MSEVTNPPTTAGSLAAIIAALGTDATRFGVTIAGRVAVEFVDDVLDLRILPASPPFAPDIGVLLEASDVHLLGRLRLAAAEQAEGAV